jgi:hypothetical protein
MTFPSLSQISVGEPDANSEFFAALRAKRRPVFLAGFYSPPHFPFAQFQTGEKYLIYGQKGTGKTSILRHIKDVSEADESEFLIFKRSFLEEVDLTDMSNIPLALDESEIKKFKHFQHTIKRLLILILIRKSFSIKPYDSDQDESDDEATKSIISKIYNSSIGDAIKFGLDSVGNIFQSLGLNVEKLTAGAALLEGGRLVKRSNDSLLSYFVKRMKRFSDKRIELYVDEIHFAYRSEESLQQDAILVRDTILAIQSLNDRFAEESIGITIFAAVRSEYLEHPIIATADINHAIESVGHELTYENFAQDKNHPLFVIISDRFRLSIGNDFTNNDLFKYYLANISPIDFLGRTWSKPRDIVRFFKCAQKLYPERVTLATKEINAVWRNYSQEAWKELKSSASPFMNPPALVDFENVLGDLAPSQFDGSDRLDIDKFSKILQPVFDKAKGSQQNFYSFEHFLRLLYILGIFSTKRKDANENDIYHSYHRGNRNFHANGLVLIHPTVLKALG